jgi:hypothetical protein
MISPVLIILNHQTNQITDGVLTHLAGVVIWDGETENSFCSRRTIINHDSCKYLPMGKCIVLQPPKATRA